MGTTDNNIWLRIQQGLKETERMMSQNQYNMAMVKARQTLECMVNFLGERALVVDGDLADSIDQLFEGRWISQAAKDRYHRIRMLGNKAVHEGDNSPQDANEAYQLLAAEVNAFANFFNSNGSQSRPASGQRTDTVKTIPISSRNPSVRPGQSRSEGPRQVSPRNNMRPPVRNAGSARTGAAAPPERSQPTRASVTRIDTIRNGQKQPGRAPQRSGQSHVSAQTRSRRRSKKKSFDPYDLIKPAIIFVILLVIVFVIIKLIPGKDDKKQTSAPEVSVESTFETMPPTETPTEPPETEPPVVKVYTTTSKLNVRAEPSTEGTKLGTLASGTVVEFVEVYPGDSTWTVIMFEGKQAYVSSEFLSVTEETQGPDSPEETTAVPEGNSAGL